MDEANLADMFPLHEGLVARHQEQSWHVPFG
jgi:hypothetical protein